MKVNQSYSHAAKLVSFLGIRNEICETHDRVHDQGDHRLVKQLHYSPLDWLVDIEIANDNDRYFNSIQQGHILNEELPGKNNRVGLDYTAYQVK